MSQTSPVIRAEHVDPLDTPLIRAAVEDACKPREEHIDPLGSEEIKTAIHDALRQDIEELQGKPINRTTHRSRSRSTGDKN